jgi:RNA polymerase sigma factor (sigma-70 family)
MSAQARSSLRVVAERLEYRISGRSRVVRLGLAAARPVAVSSPSRLRACRRRTPPNRSTAMRRISSVAMAWDREIADNSPLDGEDDLARATFSALIHPVMPALSRLVARMAPPEDRDDIVQEALMRAWAKRRTFDPTRGTFTGWLLAIAADRARKRPRRRLRLTIEAVSEPSERDHVDIEAALSRLAPHQRLAVDCFYFVGLSVVETATVMRCSEGTVKSTLSDARSRLRHALEPRA